MTAEEPVLPARSRYRSILLVGAVLAAIALVFWYFMSGSSEKEERRRPPATVGLAKAVAKDVPVTLTAIGTVQPVVAATVRTQLSGVLLAINFTEGQVVSKGQSLAQIDPRPYENALREAQGNLAQNQAQLAVARTNLQRFRTLLSQDSIAKSEVDNQQALVGQYEGAVTANRASVANARLNLGYTRIVAPVSGKIGLRQADIGNYLTPSDTNGIVVITQTSPIDVSFALPQQELPKLQKRLAADPSLEVVAFDQAGTTELARGRFLTLDNQIDAATGTVRAKARFANPGGALFPNQFVNVVIRADTLRGAITLPVNAIRNGNKGSFVFIAKADGTAEMRPVTTGPSTGGTTVILSGVKAGEQVVSEGADSLEDGAKITLPGQGARRGDGQRRRRSQ
ncbi:efflux RND transporter periplasmic adaptor subunit [Sphingomonas sp. ID0503]|uniref:efflux RND transporter periplasmic adaptor subunit n=1 Tax=Sphingomonas sp. ID0503 TaxID=3399691 RepID=UPI003AFABF3D